MKRIETIFGMALMLLVLSTCSNDSIEHAVVQDVSSVDLKVEHYYDYFLLNWPEPTMRTNKDGYAALLLSDHLYDIYVKAADDESFVYLKYVYGGEALIYSKQIISAIGAGHDKVVFGIKLKDDIQFMDFLIISDSYDLGNQPGPAHPDVVITASADRNRGTVTGSGTYAYESTVTLTAVPNDGYEFDKWNDGATINPREIYAFEDLNLVAYFYECDKNIYPAGTLSNGWIVRGQNQYRDLKYSIDIVHSGIESGDTCDVQLISPCWKNIGKKGDSFNLQIEAKYEGEADEGILRIFPDKVFYNKTPNMQLVENNKPADVYEVALPNMTDYWIIFGYVCNIGPDGADSIRVNIGFGGVPGTYSFRMVRLDTYDWDKEKDKCVGKYWYRED
jgi:hypothetical protein